MHTPDDPDIDEVRDPFVFDFDGRRYAVHGAGKRGGKPQLLLYDCDDLDRWVELGPLLTMADPVAAEVADAAIWECPNLAYVDGQWVLLISVWNWVDGAHRLDGVRYLLGDLVSRGEGLQFKAIGGGVVDDGPAFYAPQLLAEPERMLLWAWSWELSRSFAQIAQTGWAGALTFPRELFVSDGRLGSRPATELTALRRERLDGSAAGIAAGAFEVLAYGHVRLQLDDGGVQQPVVSITGTPDQPARILVDGSMVEAFAAGRCTTTRAYPTQTSRWIVDAADPVEIWSLGLG
jgi:beta-fructofuranosidase